MTVGSDLILNNCAERVCRLGLAVPAIFFLEMHKPLTGLAHSASVMAEPILGPLLGMHRVKDLSALLEERENVEKLIQLIEKRQKS